MNTKPLCIFHGGCDDGFGAAWVVNNYFRSPDFEFYPGVYQKDPPDVTGRHVIMVDFSYKLPVLDDMASKAASILILDHHKTAAEDLAGFGNSVLPTDANIRNWYDLMHIAEKAGVSPTGTLFDMNRSGAGIAWDFFHPGEERPPFINYLEDRDLWRKKLSLGDEFTIALRSYPQDFKTWDHLAENMGNLIDEGCAIQRYYRCRVEEMKSSAYHAALADRECWITNAPYFAASEVAGELCDRPAALFGAAYFEVRPGEWQYSLRSRGDFDVSEIAKQFGGGGHRNAAGFTVPEPVHRRVQWVK